MIQKHRINTQLQTDKKVVVELKQDYDLLEILSLKFTQQDAYTSLCADYGVVCGRITANNGLGVPNARVSILVPLSDKDTLDPVVSALYPYKLSSDKNADGYRYNLLPARKQHGGHTPTGKFFDQTDILSREEYLEVFEKYYRYTVKTNSSGDFMIWGVPLGEQQLHVDVDLSDMGCFSLRPFDFIRQGEDENKFDRFFKFKSDTDLDGLPQIVSFNQTVDIAPFWGNVDLCQIGITRTDFDLSNYGVKIEPVSLLLISTVTDSNEDAVKRNGVIRRKSGYKCNLQTSDGKIEGVRFTGKKVKGSDGVTLYPELEYFSPGTIEEDGSSMAVVSMNLDYMYTNEFGEQEYTNDSNKGIATSAVSRFKISLSDSSQGSTKGTTSAVYLTPNIREFNKYTGGGASEYSEAILSSYVFSDVFEDYLKVLTPTGVTLEALTTAERNHKKDLILGTNNNNIPEDYFYKFIYGKVYTPTSFQGSHYEVSGVESFFGATRRDAFLGIKEIRPNLEDDCTGTTNYIPTNFAFRNRTKFALLISQVLLFIQFIYSVILLKFAEIAGSFFWAFGEALYDFYIPWPIDWRPFEKLSERLKDFAYRIQDRFTQQLGLTIYPDCEECTTDDESFIVDNSGSSNYCRVAEVKCRLSGSTDGTTWTIKLQVANADAGTLFSNSTTLGSTYLDALFPNEAARENGGLCSGTTIVSYSSLTNLNNSTVTIPNSTNTSKYYADVYPLVEGSGSTSFTDFLLFFNNNNTASDAKFINDGTYTYIEFSNSEFVELTGLNYEEAANGGGIIDTNTYGVLRIYDRSINNFVSGTNSAVNLEEGCSKYDTLYNETLVYTYLWATGTTYGAVTDPLNPPTYSGGFQESLTRPGTKNLLSSLIGEASTGRLPYKVDWQKLNDSVYDRKTKSGLSELRDGMFTIIPVIRGGSKNLSALQEWYRRKRIGLFFCGGVVNYSYIDNWLHGLLYFFKFEYRIKWDDIGVFDLNQRGSKYPRELVFFNVLDQKFYYRSTPYNPTTQRFIGQSYSGYKEILHPTTLYDVGVRDEFFDEICFDPMVDPNCSVIRDLTATSYQDPGNILEHVINYRLDISAAKADIGDFFTNNGYSFGNVLDGDALQLISINCEAGIEAFDLDTVHYFMFNGELLDPEDATTMGYFKTGGNYGPTPIDFKLDQNGVLVRYCLNYRLGDYTQKVPFFLWDKKGEEFGADDDQLWDRTSIGVQKLQRMFSIGSTTSTTTNYLMPDGEEEYLIKPMTKAHETIAFTGNYPDMLERFEVIVSGQTPSNPTRYVDGDLWLNVISGTTKNPITGNIHVMVNGAWSTAIPYVKDSNETFIFKTAKNYSGNKQVLSTPFHFYFGLRPGSSSYDKFIKYYGPKGAFTSGE